MEPHLIILVLPAFEQDERWYHELCDVKAKLETDSLLFVQIALSGTYNLTERLSNAFSELTYIMEFCLPESPVPVWRFKDATGSRVAPCIEFTHLQQLYEGLRGGETKVVRSVLYAIQTNLLEKHPHDNLTKTDLYNSLRFVFERIQLELPGQLPALIIPVFGDDVLKTINDLQECAEHICREINCKKPGAEDVLAPKLLQFISENYSDPLFYSKTVTNRFEISGPTMQKLLYLTTGKSFFEFVEDNRLAKVQNMLSITDLPLIEISSECGFSSYNSMYKAYKRKFKISPGAVRSDT